MVLKIRYKIEDVLPRKKDTSKKVRKYRLKKKKKTLNYLKHPLLFPKTIKFQKIQKGSKIIFPYQIIHTENNVCLKIV